MKTKLGFLVLFHALFAHGETVAFHSPFPTVLNPAASTAAPVGPPAEEPRKAVVPQVPIPMGETIESETESVRMRTLMSHLIQVNESQIDEALKQIDATGPRPGEGSYSKPQVAVLAELGAQLKELTNRRARYRRLQQYLRNPAQEYWPEESAEASPRDSTLLGLGTPRKVERYRSLSRSRLLAMARELSGTLARQRADWNRVEDGLGQTRHPFNREDASLKLVATGLSRQVSGWFLQSLVFDRHNRELSMIRGLLGE